MIFYKSRSFDGTCTVKNNVFDCCVFRIAKKSGITIGIVSGRVYSEITNDVPLSIKNSGLKFECAFPPIGLNTLLLKLRSESRRTVESAYFSPLLTLFENETNSFVLWSMASSSATRIARVDDNKSKMNIY